MPCLTAPRTLSGTPLLILLKTHLHDTVTQTTRLPIAMATPLLLPGNRVTHSGELIRAVVTSAVPPLGAFEDDTARVSVDVMCVAVSTCACCRRCLREDNQMWWDSAVFSAVACCHIFMLNPTLRKQVEICELHGMNFISNRPPPDTKHNQPNKEQQ